MSTTALINARVVAEDREIDSGFVVIDDKEIVSVGAGRPRMPADNQIDLSGKIIVPGFIDLQINGGGGVLFNDAPTLESVELIAAAHRKYGVAGLCPTLISDGLSTIERGINAVEEAVARGVAGVIGLHVEGPFLNAEKRGIHPANKIRKFTADAMDILTSARQIPVILTIAPEFVEASQLKKLTESGVRVSAGHTNATYDETYSALKAGVSSFTHLFNAMSPLHSRAPGVICAALESNAWCGIIVDGEHVHPAMLRMAIRAKSDRRFILVSDAMPTVGSDMDHFFIGGERISMVDGVLRSNDGTLAGAALDMSMAVRNAINMLGISLVEAVRFASLNPAAFLGLSHISGSIAPGKQADFAVLSTDLTPVETWISGVRYVG
ncbi:N-acetylglucosamine-6-phosphate deacetylase [Hyphococcus luteus]|uniref:N-acetylglucosamine-6-phosphate deacetylase n=1 Tax=Hyphococcus luteus TaxID=2058213 RepID=A0A2S7K9Y2_9PROT|nr:N-acetylglucosamine-6-phosphate deacetylase [Marinicaulis flavus]PQA89305.1 N-acetylglucosamine-6-phosphate deacetylase [Marinicaulis flavus]